MDGGQQQRPTDIGATGATGAVGDEPEPCEPLRTSAGAANAMGAQPQNHVADADGRNVQHDGAGAQFAEFTEQHQHGPQFSGDAGSFDEEDSAHTPCTASFTWIPPSLGGDGVLAEASEGGQQAFDIEMVKSAARTVEASARQHIRSIQGRTMQYAWAHRDQEMCDLDVAIDGMLAELTLKSSVLRLKARTYARWFDRSQVLQFAASTIVALAAAIQSILSVYLVDTRNLTSVDTLPSGFNFGFSMFILLLSSTSAFLTLMVKFRGWKEKADDMNAVYRRSIDVLADLQFTQNKLKTSSTIDMFRVIKEEFFAREYKLYTETVQAINEHLSFDSHTNHVRGFYEVNLKHKGDQAAYYSRLMDMFVDEKVAEQHMSARMALLKDQGVHSVDEGNFSSEIM